MSVGERCVPWDEQALLTFLCMPLSALGIPGYRYEGSPNQSQNNGHLYWTLSKNENMNTPV